MKHKHLLNFLCIFIAARPTFAPGEFKVEYTANTAKLSWPKPSGIYTRQAIQKRKVSDRKKQAVSECNSGNRCEEENVPNKNLTTYETKIEPNQKYKFWLVLYDGNIVVQSLESPTTVTPSGKYVNRLQIF